MGAVGGQESDVDGTPFISAEADRLERHGRRVCVGERRSELNGGEMGTDAGISAGMGSDAQGGVLSPAESSVMRGEGDRGGRRPDREGSADKRDGDGARGGSSVKPRSVVDSESLGKLSDEEDEHAGGTRKWRLCGPRTAESPEHVEGAGLAPKL